MVGSVQKGDLGQFVFAVRVGERNGISADMLGNAAGFTGSDVGFANDIEQGGLAMVNMAHDRNDRRARNQVFGLVFDVEFDFLDWRVDDAAAAFALFHFKAVPVIGADALGNSFVDSLIDGGKNVETHQIGNDF